MSQLRIDYKLLTEFDTEALREFDAQLKQRMREEEQRLREESKPKKAKRRGRRR